MNIISRTEPVVERSPEVQQRNKRTIAIIISVVLLLFLGSVFYIMFFGGTNKGPMKPLHSSVYISESDGIS